MNNYDWKCIDGNKSYRFSDSDQAESLILDLGWKSTEDFMEEAMFSTVENQFSDNDWSWPETMDWSDFVESCSGLWISFDSDVIYLDEDLGEFLKGLELNFQGFISEKVTTMNYGSQFEITIGGRSVTFNGDLQVISSGSVVGG